MFEPAVKNLTFDARMGFVDAFKFRGSNGVFLNLEGFRIECDIRKSFDADPVVIMNSATNGWIGVWPADPEIIVISLGIDATDITPGTYEYDVIAVPSGGLPIKLIKGKVVVNPTITRVND
jgi:hypothetical protein